MPERDSQEQNKVSLKTWLLGDHDGGKWPVIGGAPAAAPAAAAAAEVEHP